MSTTPARSRSQLRTRPGRPGELDDYTRALGLLDRRRHPVTFRHRGYPSVACCWWRWSPEETQPSSHPAEMLGRYFVRRRRPRPGGGEQTGRTRPLCASGQAPAVLAVCRLLRDAELRCDLAQVSPAMRARRTAAACWLSAFLRAAAASRSASWAWWPSAHRPRPSPGLLARSVATHVDRARSSTPAAGMVRRPFTAEGFTRSEPACDPVPDHVHCQATRLPCQSRSEVLPGELAAGEQGGGVEACPPGRTRPLTPGDRGRSEPSPADRRARVIGLRPHRPVR
jgi:hypothetical protein